MKVKYMLGDISDVSAGQGAPQKESDFCNVGKPFIRAGSLAKLVEGYSEHSVCELINDDTAKIYGLRLYPKNTIIFAKSGKSTTKGYVHVLSQECYIVNHLACINMYNDNSSYMKYYFRYYKPNQLIKDDAYPSISLTDIRNMIVNIHNIQTQKEIVAVLDKVTLLISMRKEQLEKLDILVKSKFIEMFGDPYINSKGFVKAPMGNYITVLTDFSANGSYKKLDSNVKMTDTPEYAWMVRTIDLESGNMDSIKYIDKKAYELLSKSKIFGGEIIMNKIGSAGKVYLMPEISFPASLGRNAFLFRYDERINVKYLYHLLISKYGTSEIQRYVQGAVTKTITKDSVRAIEIIVPDIDLQNQFAEFVEHVEKNKEKIKSSLNQLETLYSALMQEYFG